MFLTFRQNNSGGNFVITDDVRVTVIVEGTGAVDAINRAEALGIYFNGCEKGIDCPCCGDRWYDPTYGELDYRGDPVPSIYGTPIDEELIRPNHLAGDQIIIHYLDGTRKYVGTD
jgi:hypothetical protein